MLLFLYFLFLSEYLIILNEKSKNNYKPTNNVNINEVVSLDKVLKYIIDNKLDNLDLLNITFTNIDDVSNQNKLKLAFYYYKDDVDFNVGVSYTKLNNYIYNVFGEKVKIKSENILNFDKTIVKYDKINEIYIREDTNNKIKDVYFSSYNYVINFENKNNEHILLINKFYEKDNKVYSSYGDLINDIDVIFEIPILEDKNTYIKNYVNSNYDKIKDLDSYKYTFIKERSALVLKSYEILK